MVSFRGGRTMSDGNGLTEIRLHGRGGQGVVFAATALAEAAHRDGKHVQAFGLFGAERRGAPVTAFVRAGDRADMPRCRIQEPGVVVSFSANLPGSAVLAGLKPGGTLLLNCPSEKMASSFADSCQYAVKWVDATGLALASGLGSVGIPVINTVMLGAVVKATGLATLESLLAVLAEKIPRNTEKNLAAARRGYEGVRELECHVKA